MVMTDLWNERIRLRGGLSAVACGNVVLGFVWSATTESEWMFEVDIHVHMQWIYYDE